MGGPTQRSAPWTAAGPSRATRRCRVATYCARRSASAGISALLVLSLLFMTSCPNSVSTIRQDSSTDIGADAGMDSGTDASTEPDNPMDVHLDTGEENR